MALKNLSNPPIIEALAQINYSIGRPVTEDDLKKWETNYPGHSREEIKQIKINPNGTIELTPFGVKLQDKQSHSILQVTRDFFAYSSTGPYEGWDKYFTLAKDQIDRFLKTSGVVNISRVALRYINRMDVLEPNRDLTDLLKVFPETGQLGAFAPETSALTLTMALDELDARANMNIKIDRSTDDKRIIHLDIDVFVMGKFNPSIVALEKEFDTLRKAKNEIFKRSLTDEAISSFDR